MVAVTIVAATTMEVPAMEVARMVMTVVESMEVTVA